MAKITAKENYLMMARGEKPYWVPYYSMFGIPFKGECAFKSLRTEFYEQTMFQPGGKDLWGVEYVASAEAGGATMPDTTKILLHDIADWRKVIKFPKMIEVSDWREQARKDTEALGIDRNETAIMAAGPGNGFFQTLVALMGFEGGLMALYTDPDECKELFGAMLEETILPAIDIIFDYYDFDLFGMADDTCAKTTPFFSPEIYEDVFLPAYSAVSKRAVERGIPVDFHNCGRMDEFMPFMEKFGVKYTNPAQETNDVAALAKEYKGRMVLCGGWDWDSHMPADYPNYDEEMLREGVRHSIDAYSKEGNYVFAGGVQGAIGDETAMKISAIVKDEAHTYGKKVYGYTGE